MRKIFTSSVLAIAVAMTGISSAPARASNDDFGRAVAGIIVLTIIGNAIRDANMDKNAKSKKKASASKNRHVDVPIGKKKGHIRPQRALPRQCFFVMREKTGPRGVYGQKCVEQLSARPVYVPRKCVDTVPVRYGRNAKVYDAQCLRRYGYQVEARRH